LARPAIDDPVFGVVIIAVTVGVVNCCRPDIGFASSYCPSNSSRE
jgi:hypothetical protein